ARQPRDVSPPTGAAPTYRPCGSRAPRDRELHGAGRSSGLEAPPTTSRAGGAPRTRRSALRTSCARESQPRPQASVWPRATSRGGGRLTLRYASLTLSFGPPQRIAQLVQVSRPDRHTRYDHRGGVDRRDQAGLDVGVVQRRSKPSDVN